MEQQISETLSLIEETQAEINALSDDEASTDATPASPVLDPQSGQDTTQKGYLEANLAMYRSTYATLHKDYEQMRLDVINATPYVIVVEKALLPESPVKPPKKLYTILAGTIALFISIGLVFLFEYLDDTIKTPEDVTKALGLVTIGVISMIKKGEDELVTTANPLSPVAEEFRMLRANIRSLSNRNTIKTILVTSPSANEGKSVTVSNLAVAMAQAGLNVIAVEADLHHPRLYSLFKMRPRLEPRHDKLSKVKLAGNSNGQLHLAHVGRLRIPIGNDRSSASGGLYASIRIQEELQALTDEADIVLLDTPPVTSIVDTIELAQIVDGVLLVVKSGRTHSQAARYALESISQVGASPLGVVLTAAPVTRANYYAYRESNNGEQKRQKSSFLKKSRVVTSVQRMIERLRQAFMV
jgi:non-specific protein-tyrosine kinase